MFSKDDVVISSKGKGKIKCGFPFQIAQDHYYIVEYEDGTICEELELDLAKE